MNSIWFSICLIFSVTFFVVNGQESLFLTPAVKTNVTQFRYYECDSEESSVTHLQASARYESERQSCNHFSYDGINTTYSIVINNKTHDIEITLHSYTVSLNGNSIFMRSGTILSGPCEGGQLDELTFALADDPNGCHGKGLAQVTPVYATLRINGGKCQVECNGGVTTVYDPPIINSSDDISFRACDQQ